MTHEQPRARVTGPSITFLAPVRALKRPLPVGDPHPPTGGEVLLFQMAYRTRCCGLTGMRTCVTDGTEAHDPGARGIPPSLNARSLVGITSLSMPTVRVKASCCYLRQDYF